MHLHFICITLAMQTLLFYFCIDNIYLSSYFKKEK